MLSPNGLGCKGKGKESLICIALYYELVICKALRYDTS